MSEQMPPDDELFARDDELSVFARDDELSARLNLFPARYAPPCDPLYGPVPEPLLAAARDAFSLRELHARVAELVRDSVVDLPVSPVREPGCRKLSFESGDVAVECEITAYASRRDIYGQLVGGNASVVDAEVAGRAAVTVRVDANGCFGVRGLASGPVRLRCRLADGTTLVTSWAVI